MCCIAGIINSKSGDFNENRNLMLLHNMIDEMRHRGPDGEGMESLSGGMAYIGHRRLSIIDLSSAASQPMKDASGRYTITYNGELYNYKELRQELEEIGKVFHSNSDTEVALQSYITWGEKAVLKFNGMFAFGVWDEYKEELFLARDRYGIKPLYYSIINNQFVFASEYKAIILHPFFNKSINYFALKQYFTFQNILTQDTLFEGIQILQSGCIMKLKAENLKIQIKQYWDFNFSEDNSISTLNEIEDIITELFEQAVKRQMVSDVPIGSYLSGGVDSGMITAVASMKNNRMKSFTCGMDLHSASGMELAFDEREKAEYLSYCYKTEHYEMVLKAGDMERCMKSLVWHMEDPRVGQSYPNFYASNLASRFVKVVLAGTGGDELFAGYPWRYYRVSNSKSYEEYISLYYDYWQRLLTEEEIKDIFKPIDSIMKPFDMKMVFSTIFHGLDEYRCWNDEYMTPEKSINESLYFEAKTFLHGLLIVEDKLSMAHGLETRVPFLDNDLVDFVQRLPVRFKLKNLLTPKFLNENTPGHKINMYYDSEQDGKLILRSIAKRFVPEMIYAGKKQGFSAPDASWFKGDSLEYVKSILFNKNSKLFDYLDYETVNNIIRSHLSGKVNRRLLIWSLLNFEEWLKLYY